MPRLQRNPGGVVSLGPILMRSEPSRQRPDPTVGSLRWSKGLAAAAGVSDSFCRRQLRGEQPVRREQYDSWLERLVNSGHLSIARARVAEDARIVRCALVQLPEHDGVGSLEELAGLQEAAAELSGQVMRDLADGVRSRDELLEELKRLHEMRERIAAAEAAVLAELERMDDEKGEC